ncbi:MAG: hypothetical protein OXD45_14315, partial [Rhodobacteraceae bacterium]|nr:hypothetical protein [Paracoccaceae bacterium]
MIESKDMEEVMTMAREELDALIATIPNYDRLDDTPYFKDSKPFKKLKGKGIIYLIEFPHFLVEASLVFRPF